MWAAPAGTCVPTPVHSCARCPPPFALPGLLRVPLPRPAPQFHTPIILRSPAPPAPTSSRRSSPAPAAVTPSCPSCHLFSFARVRISPVPSPHPPEPSSRGPRPPPGSPSPGHPVQRHPNYPSPPLLQVSFSSFPTLPPSSCAPPSPPLQKGQSVLASATVAPGPHNGARPTRPMAAAIGKESRANAFSGWNSRTSPAGPAGPSVSSGGCRGRKPRDVPATS